MARKMAKEKYGDFFNADDMDRIVVEAVPAALDKYDLKLNTRFSTLAMTIVKRRLADEYGEHRNNGFIGETRLLRTIRRQPLLTKSWRKFCQR
jgi:DNA-directed RNA polymerase specialized sigma subunit